MLRKIFNGVVNTFSSLGLSVVLLLLLGLLTWLGTLEQVEHGLYDVQKKYFESFFLIHDSGPVPLPLPGANLVLCVLAVNILVGGMIRIRKSKQTAGIIITHVGIALLLLSGFVKMYFSQDGHVSLYPGEQAATYQSYYRWEVVVYEDLGNGRVKEYIVPKEDFVEASESTVTLTSGDLPFDLELSGMMGNCRTMPKGPMFEVDVPVVDGVFLMERDKDTMAERNVAGLYVTAVHEDGRREEGLLFGLQRHPWTVHAGAGHERHFAVDLRHEQYPMPFSIRLDKFTKEEHARTTMASSFSSDVTLVESGVSREVEISMNEPLRDRGLVVYQASYGPDNAPPGTEMYSTLSVVRNPADQYPLYACIVIAAGLILHFSRKLVRYVRIEAKTA